MTANNPTDNTNFLTFADWFVPQYETGNIPPTIYNRSYYDPSGQLWTVKNHDQKTQEENIKFYLRKKAIIRNGHEVKNPNIIYDFSLQRMALHEVIVGLVTHFRFDNQSQFTEVCRKIYDEIQQTQNVKDIGDTAADKLSDIQKNYKEFLELLTPDYIARNNLHPACIENRSWVKSDRELWQETVKPAPFAEEHIKTKRLEYNENIKRYKKSLERNKSRTALQKERDSWVDAGDENEVTEEQTTRYVQLIRPVLIEEERVRWKKRELRKLICGEDEAYFDGSLLAQLAAKQGLPRLTSYDATKRKAVLIVGGQAAGKTALAKKALDLEGTPDVMNLNTDWIKSPLLDRTTCGDDVMQFGSITHQESAYVCDLAAERWRSMALAGSAPHLMAELSTAGSWRNEMANAGGTVVKIHAAVKNVRRALGDAWKRGQPDGNDPGRFSPTPALVKSHRNQFRSNLDAMIDGLPLEIYNTGKETPIPAAQYVEENVWKDPISPDAMAEDVLELMADHEGIPIPVVKDDKLVGTLNGDQLSSGGRVENLMTRLDPNTLPKEKIDKFKVKDRKLLVNDLATMWDYFSNPELNIDACREEDLWHGTHATTAANMLEYAKHMTIMASCMELRCTQQPSNPNDKTGWKFTCIIEDWEGFCREIGDEKKAKYFIEGLAAQRLLIKEESKDTSQFMVDFVVDSKVREKDPAKATKIQNHLNDIIEPVRRFEDSDPYFGFQKIAHDLETKAEGHHTIIKKLKDYATLLKQMIALEPFRPAGFHVIKYEDWHTGEKAYPLVINEIRKTQEQVASAAKATETPSERKQERTEYVLLAASLFRNPKGKLIPEGNISAAQCYNKLSSFESLLAKQEKELALQPDEEKELNAFKNGLHIVTDDVLKKYLERTTDKGAEVALYVPKATSQLFPLKLDEDDQETVITSLFDLTHAKPFVQGGQESSVQNNPQDKPKEQVIVLPKRYREALTEQLKAFNMAFDKKDWEKALRCLFYPDGQARFPCMGTSDKLYEIEMPEAYMDLLAQILHRSQTVKMDPTGKKAYIFMQVPAVPGKKPCPFPTRDGRKELAKRGEWIGIELLPDSAEREKEIEKLRDQLMSGVSTPEALKYPIQGFDPSFVECCTSIYPEIEQVPDEKEIEDRSPKAKGIDPDARADALAKLIDLRRATYVITDRRGRR